MANARLRLKGMTEPLSGTQIGAYYAAVLVCEIHGFACSPDARHLMLCPWCAQNERKQSYERFKSIQCNTRIAQQKG